MSNNSIDEIIDNIRKLTPNHPGYTIEHKQTYTHKQWQFNLKVSQNKENLRKKSKRLSTREEEIVSTFDDLDRLLEEESETIYKKKWSRLGKRYKINRLMIYYNKSTNQILEIYDKIKDTDVEYSESEGRIKKITVKNIFKNEKIYE